MSPVNWWSFGGHRRSAWPVKHSYYNFIQWFCWLNYLLFLLCSYWWCYSWFRCAVVVSLYSFVIVLFSCMFFRDFLWIFENRENKMHTKISCPTVYVILRICVCVTAFLKCIYVCTFSFQWIHCFRGRRGGGGENRLFFRACNLFIFVYFNLEHSIFEYNQKLG